MGGNALKNCVTRRYQAGEFAVLADEVLHALRRGSPDRRAALLPANRSKADFGDMDVLVEIAPVGEIRHWPWTPRTRHKSLPTATSSASNAANCKST